jgi:hypothetical protein
MSGIVVGEREPLLLVNLEKMMEWLIKLLFQVNELYTTQSASQTSQVGP